MADDKNKKTPTAVETKIEALETMVSDLKKSNDDLSVRLEKLETPKVAKKAAPKKKPQLPEETFTIDKKKYKFKLAAFRLDGVKVLATDAMEDKDIQAKLVKGKYTGIIEEA